MHRRKVNLTKFLHYRASLDLSKFPFEKYTLYGTHYVHYQIINDGRDSCCWNFEDYYAEYGGMSEFTLNLCTCVYIHVYIHTYMHVFILQVGPLCTLIYETHWCCSLNNVHTCTCTCSKRTALKFTKFDNWKILHLKITVATTHVHVCSM